MKGTLDWERFDHSGAYLSSRLRPDLTRAGLCVPPHRHARLLKDTLLALAANTADAVLLAGPTVC